MYFSWKAFSGENNWHYLRSFPVVMNFSLTITPGNQEQMHSFEIDKNIIVAVCSLQSLIIYFYLWKFHFEWKMVQGI